jgi:MFS family permease
MRSIVAVELLRNPVYRRLWFVTMIGGLSVGATLTTLGWVVVEESGSPLLVSFVLVTFLAPQMVAGPIGGVLADRYGRGRIIRIGISARLLLAIAMAASLFFLPHELAPLFAINTVRSVTSGATIPSRRAFMADIVTPRQLTTALALDEFAITTTFMAGPIATGFLLLVLEPGVIFLGLAGISVVGVLLVPRAPERLQSSVTGDAATRRPSFIGDLFEGFGYIRRSRVLIGITAISLAAELLAFNYMTLIPVFAKEVFEGGSGLLGILNGTMPVGELFGAAFMAAFALRVVKPGRLLMVSVAAIFMVGIPLGASTWLPGTLILLAVIGGLGQMFFVMTSTLLLRETPPGARARVLGLQQLTWGAGALGGLASGALATAFNPHLGIIIPSAVGLAVVIVIIVIFPELRSVRGNVAEDEPPQESTDATVAGAGVNGTGK